MARSRGYCFTLNNYSEEEFNNYLAISCRYVVLGREVGENGTPHIQGFIYFDNARKESSVRGLLRRSHVERQRGTCEQAITYCKKDGNFIERGDPPSVRGGTDKWAEMLLLARNGDWTKLADSYPSFWIRYETNFRKQRIYYVDTLDPSVRNEWYYGPSGSGKSRLARENDSLYLKKRNKWWDGYDDQDTVLIEEWSPELRTTTAQELKIWADIYSFAAEIKGGMIHIRPRKIIITSNYTIDECFDFKDVEPIKRRFNITRFGNL